MKTKELTIEEKAKAYDRALANAKEQAIDGYLDAVAVIDIFPELAESEDEDDEKIRKSIIEFVKQNKSFHYLLGVSKEDAVAWLEKQGEQKPAEWSKEDERNFDIIYGIIYNSCIAEDASRLNAWLLSLKPKKQWKPSDNELEVLRLAAEKDGICLMGLYEQLKKLKE